MVGLSGLYLPIVVSAVLTFIVSALVWMVLPHHKKDWSALPNEDAVRNALNAQKPGPGQYMIPAPKGGGMNDMSDPAVQKKLQEGPVGFLTLKAPGVQGMGPMMMQSVVFYLAVSTLVAYIAGRTTAPGTDYLHVFRVAGAVAWLAYGFGGVPDSIWFGKPWSVSLKGMFDGLLMALVTAGTFGWLWPR